MFTIGCDIHIIETSGYYFMTNGFAVIYANLCFDFREKKREKERDELWKRLGELELNHNKKMIASHNSPPSKK